MSEPTATDSPNLWSSRGAPILPRKSLCLSSDQPGVAVHGGDSHFAESVVKHFDVEQSNAVEQLVALKEELRVAEMEFFWRRLMEGMTSICNAQYGFVAKTTRANEEDTIQRPRITEPRSSVLGVAYTLSEDGPHIEEMHSDHKFFTSSTLRAHMKHDKVFLIPEKLSSFFQDEADQLPFAGEAYLGVPLFLEGECFAHFGLMWSEDGLKRRNLPWSYLEMILHSLEEMIIQRILAGDDLEKTEKQNGTECICGEEKPHNDSHTPVDHKSSPFSFQPLKPYARSLSHELRTPMQGVVGMLDVIHATVQEALDNKPNAEALRLFQSLKENIEAVQDSARRAVEAADNVVHAYDLNMEVPETPKKEIEEEILGDIVLPPAAVHESRPSIFIEGNNIAINPYKRRRSNAIDWNYGPSAKRRLRELSPRSEEVKHAVHESDQIVYAVPERHMEEVVANAVKQTPSLAARRSASHILLEGPSLMGPVFRHTKIRNLLCLVINEALHVGGRPESAVGEATAFGERIEIRSRSSNGEASSKMIEWSVDPAVPETVLVDDRDLAKLISCVFLNAVKFTERGEITVAVKLNRKSHSILINVKDTGTGIPAAFLPNLFKPFAREDDSTTRSKEGLGLGLLVAKGLSRKMGGDLTCVRSSTSGPTRGSEFEIRVPISPTDSLRRPITPTTRPQSILRTSFPDNGPDSDGCSEARPDSSGQGVNPSENSGSPYLYASQQLSPESMDSGSCPTPCGVFATPKSSHVPIGRNGHDSTLAEKYPLTFLVAEDNKINRRILVSMLGKLGYHDVYEAFDGREAVRIMSDILLSHYPPHVPVTPPSEEHANGTLHNALSSQGSSPPKKLKFVDVVLMDLWMPEMDGYEATSRIFELVDEHTPHLTPYLRRESHPRPSLSVEVDASRVTAPASSPLSPTVLAVSADVTDEALGRASKVGMEGFMTKPYKLSDLERLIVEFCGGKTNVRGCFTGN